MLLNNDEPLIYVKAMMGSNSEKWLGVMRSELKSMDVNQVWNMVGLPKGVKTIECKWIFKKKINMDENIQIHKPQLDTKGF